MYIYSRTLIPTVSFFFFFNDTATTEIYTLSLHDALPICAERRLGEAVACHVGEGELAQVAQALGQQEGQDGPAHQEADGVDQAVIAAGHDRGRDAQEGGGRHVVARNQIGRASCRERV